MIYLDIDGVCIDFIGTAKKFGVELEHNVFGKWKWCDSTCDLHGSGNNCCNVPTPEEFYAEAIPQPWFNELYEMLCYPQLVTVDYGEIKQHFLNRAQRRWDLIVTEAPDKSVHCKHPCDVLIDDNRDECERWRKAGGIAWWFNLAEEDPFGQFLKWWRLGKI